MEDTEIVALFWARDEAALDACAEKYGKLLYKLSLGVLCAKEDCEEVLDDAYLAAWNAIPPARPQHLGAYLCKIVRNLSVKKYRYNHAAKRSTVYAACIDELAELLPAPENVETAFDAAETGALISAFLRAQDPNTRALFVRRYFFLDTPAEIAARYGMKQNTVKSILYRTRKKLAEYLQKEGVQP